MIKRFFKIIIISLVILIIYIAQSEKINKFFDRNFFYKKKYEDIVSSYSKKFDVDESLIYSIIQNESAFFPYAKSKVNARGLMQIMPVTWEHAQKVLGFKNSDSYDKNLNIMVGTWYLKYLSTLYQDERYIIMAYNAGPENINNWIKQGFLEGDDISKWNIPFVETRSYLEKVLESKKNYEKLCKESTEVSQ